MKIALLCPGHSLTYTYPGVYSMWDGVVAVNSAAWLYNVDWLAFSDRHIIEPLRAFEFPRPIKGVVTNGAHVLWEGCERRRMPIQDAESPHLTPAMRALADTQGTSECGWTFPNALHFALQLAGESGEVHVFGFDYTDEPLDVAGVAGQHNAGRWARELPWVRLVWDHRCHNHGKANFP